MLKIEYTVVADISPDAFPSADDFEIFKTIDQEEKIRNLELDLNDFFLGDAEIKITDYHEEYIED